MLRVCKGFLFCKVCWYFDFGIVICLAVDTYFKRVCWLVFCWLHVSFFFLDFGVIKNRTALIGVSKQYGFSEKSMNKYIK